MTATTTPMTTTSTTMTTTGDCWKQVEECPPLNKQECISSYKQYSGSKQSLQGQYKVCKWRNGKCKTPKAWSPTEPMPLCTTTTTPTTMTTTTTTMTTTSTTMTTTTTTM